MSVSFATSKDLASATMDSPFSVAVNDFNKDGKADYVASGNGSGNVCVFLGNGNGTFTSAEYPTDFNPRTVRTADLNGDGKPDIVVAENDEGKVGVLLNKGNGTFNTAVAYTAVPKTYGIALGDFTGDGKIDIAAGGETQNSIVILKNNGSGTFTALTTKPSSGSNPVSLAAADFNHDGKMDLVAADTSDDDFKVFLGNGNGTFQTPKTVTLGSTPQAFAAVRAADVDGDGNQDVVITDNAANKVYVYWGKGDGTFSGHATLSTGNDPRDVNTADVNGDGKLDVLVACDDFGSLELKGNAGDAEVFVNNGNRAFATAQKFTTHGGPQGIAAGDFNGDKKPDIVTANFFSDDTSLLLNSTTFPTNNPIIVDDKSSSGVTITGSWTSSTYTAGFFGSDYLNDGNTGKGSKSVTFTPNLPTTGLYQVFARWTSGTNRATNVPFTITHQGTATTIAENQRQNGGQWVLLGTFQFNAGTGGSVKVSNTGTNGFVIADAVEFVKAPAATGETVDDGAAAFTGTWGTSSGITGFVGTGYHYNDGFHGAGTANYVPDPLTGATYLVYAQWSAFSNRADNARFDISYVNGAASVFADQQRDGGQMVLLGAFPFSGSSGHVVINNAGADGNVVADAVRWTPSAGGAAPAAASNLHATAASAFQINLTWTDNATNETGYQVERRVGNSGPFTIVAQLGANAHSFNDAGLLGGTSYTYRVRAFNGSGFGAYSTTASTFTNGLHEIRADNQNPLVTKITGSWGLARSTTGYVGGDYLTDQNTGKGTKSVKFTPVLPTTGMYVISMTWTIGSDRATNVPVDILHNGITTTVLVNEQKNGAATLGTFAFTAGSSSSITIRTTGTNGLVIADSVDFVLLPPS